MKRREFLQKSAIVVAGAAAAASVVALVGNADEGNSASWTAGLKTLNAHEGETLLKVARQIFPHDRLDDSDYVVVVQDLDTEEGHTPDTAKVLHDGLANPDSGNAKFVTLSDDQQLAVLQKNDNSPFFQKVH